jgi:hypothetical protein
VVFFRRSSKRGGGGSALKEPRTVKAEPELTVQLPAVWRGSGKERSFLMEQTVEANAAGLLNGVTGIIKGYEARWQKTGEQYNIFKAAGIAHKEVVMCRVLADLMNPRGKHGQGSRYLKSFWETIASKLPGRLALDIEHTRVTSLQKK